MHEAIEKCNHNYQIAIILANSLHVFSRALSEQIIDDNKKMNIIVKMTEARKMMHDLLKQLSKCKNDDEIKIIEQQICEITDKAMYEARQKGGNMTTIENLKESLVEISENVEAVVCNNNEIHLQLEELKKMYEPENIIY